MRRSTTPESAMQIMSNVMALVCSSLICQRDLEGIVAKLKHGHYTCDLEDSTWIKIKNRNIRK